MFTIHPFEPTEENYEAIAAIEKAVWPDDPITVAEFKHFDATWNSAYFRQRLLIKWHGRIVAYAICGETPGAYLPGKYRWRITVHPDYERRGIGTAVYDHVLQILNHRELKPVLLESGTYEYKRQSIRFLETRGFKQVMRWIVSTLDMANFDLGRYAGLRQKIADEGIVIRPLTLQKQLDPDWQHNLYELDWELTLDEPLPTPPTKLPFEEYVSHFIDEPGALHEAWFVALADGRYVGMTQLLTHEGDPTRFNTGFSGVVRSHRRRGLATALKLAGIEYAQRASAKLIHTSNEENNPMYTLNRNLGFTDLTARLAFEKRLTETQAVPTSKGISPEVPH